MSAVVVVLTVLLAYGLLVWLIIWADARDQAAYDRWHDSPDRIWNTRKKPRR